MSSCLICPSWSPCKCEGGPTVANYIPHPGPQTALMAAAHVDRLPVGGTRPGVKTLYTPTKRIDIRAKGANGEREIINVLIPIVQRCMREQGFRVEQVTQAYNCIQRNQNQSAVGGNDLSHTFGLSFEVKRQEALSINTWWNQCAAAAKPNNELPVLVYRQNKQAWRVVTMGALHLPPTEGSTYGSFNCRLEMDWQTFLTWFGHWVSRKLQNGELPRGVDA